MAELGIEAARWVVGKALGPASSGLLEAWAASSELGPNVEALRMELLYAEGMLNNARGRGHGPGIQNPALTELLQKLRDLAYRADDVMDELEYFRIQDELDGTYHAADEHSGGCLYNHALNARHAVRNIRKMLGFTKCSGSSATASHDEQDEDTSRGVSCGAWSCLGPKSTADDDEQEEEARRGVSPCGAVWLCGTASSKQPMPSPTSSGNQEVASGCMSMITSRACAKMPDFSKCSGGCARQENEDVRASSSMPPQPEQEAHDTCMGRLTSAARGTIDSLGKQLPCSSVSHAQNAANSTSLSTACGFLCCARSNKAPQRECVPQAPKLKFDRVEMSRKMKEIVEQLKPLCARVSTILNLELLDSSRSIAQCISTSLDTWFSRGTWPTPLHRNAMMSRPVTTSEFREPELYGRKHEKSDIIYDITKGKYREKDLTVLPIVGPGGIGKTTLMQYIYKELEKHFEVMLWVCVSLNFNVYRLTQEIANKLKIDTEDNPDKGIEEKLKSKRFLLVLDDMWNCSNMDEWDRFLAPFTKGQTKGSVILVTTRFPALAQMVKTTDHWKDLKGLDEEEFKKLFVACVFDDKKSQYEHSELLETIGYEIVKKLKGSPLAAKTVGRLLRNHLDFSHWTRVLESKEWESQNQGHDIMPALKLSFDYLPFHLQQCFTYSALFPEDYEFGKEELIQFWIGLDVLHSRGENRSIEDIGLNYLTELVNYGFFKKEENENGHTYYIIHDLLHELAIKVSSDECLSICSSNNVRSIQVPPSIRHLSINIDESSVIDRKNFDICKEDFNVLGKRLKVENLHSLMLFGKQQDGFVRTFRGLLSKARALRLILISGGKYRMEDLFHNFLILFHLRYLRIHNYNPWKRSKPPKKISRFYHLKVLDLQGCVECFDVPRHMRNLIKLRHFLVPNDEMHASIFEVGSLKSLQELRRFEVGKGSQGFELRQIGSLLELCKLLSIGNLENVEGREEAEGAKLIHKKHLQGLILNWNANGSNKDSAREEQVLEGLKPHSNLLNLSIQGHGGATCPSWLVGPNLSVKSLDSICLDGVAWETFPPIGEFSLVNKNAEEILSNIPGQHFNNLTKIELKNLAKLERWVIGSSGQLLSHLEVLIIEGCPELVELSFPNYSCGQQEQNATSFLRLQKLSIYLCPKLVSLPPVPWTSARCSLKMSLVGLCIEYVDYENDPYEPELFLAISGNDNAQDMAFRKALDFFDKLTGPEKLSMTRCPPMPLDGLQRLSSTIKHLVISELNRVNGKDLTQVLACLPKLSELEIYTCEKITGLGVVEQQKEAASSSEEEEIAPSDELLLLPPQLHDLEIGYCPELSLRPNSAQGGNGGGLQALSCLHSLTIRDCPKFLASYSPSSLPSSCFPFPTSLQSLRLYGVETLAPLSNLSSLARLWIGGCGGSGGSGLGRLLAHGCLHGLSVSSTPNFFSIECSKEDTPEMLEHGSPFPPSSKLQSLDTDDLAAPVCTLLSSSLTSLTFYSDEMERFTKEQGEALQLLTSLQKFQLFACGKLQCIPPGLQKLTNLKTLEIWCASIRSLPKDSLPNSLRYLAIRGCSSIRSLPKDGLPDSLQELEISNCPSIRALPKAGLPSSLQKLDVSRGNSEELTRHCRKLIGTIPIVEV